MFLKKYKDGIGLKSRKLYLARHGQRLDTVQKHWFTSYDNEYDPPLSELGLQQARLLGQGLVTEPIDVIISSPYLRALQTAEAIATVLGQGFYVDMGLGEWQGKAMMPKPPALLEPAHHCPSLSKMDLSHCSTVFPSYPESVDEVFERYHKTVIRLLDIYTGNLLLVGHGRVVTGTAHVLTRKPEAHFLYPLAGYTQLALDETGWQALQNGIDAHLNEELETHYV